MTDLNTFRQTYAAPSNDTAAPGMLSKVKSGIANVGKDAFNTLIATPAVRLGQAAGSLIAPHLGASQDNIQKASQQDTNVPVLGGINVPAQKNFGQGGAEQIGGQGLKSASYLVPGMEAEGIASKGVIRGATQGAKLGVLGGGLSGAGNAMEQGGSTSDVISGAGKGAITGGITGGALGGATGVAGNIWDSVHNGGSYQSTLDAATQANNQAGENALGAGNEITGTFSDIKNDAGAQFRQASQDITRTNPNAQAIIPTDLIGKMNEVKGGSGFELPNKINPSSPEFGGNIKLGDIAQGGVPHTPAEMQDLIGKFNDVAFKAKASGELKINQQAATVAKELHEIASNSFGNVIDAQGNSVWDNAYQNYRQVSDLTDKMSSLFNMNRTPGEVSDPLELNKMIGSITKLGETTQGRAILRQSATQIKQATGYDITDPIATITKLSKSNADLETALKGGYGHQFVEALKNPRLLSRKTVGVAFTLLSVTAAAAAFRKSIGNAIAGQ